MNERERLIELLKKVDQTVSEEIADGEVTTGEEMYGSTADYLLANGVMVQRWIPVTERLPEKDKYVLYYSNKFGDVSHWMPLPEPPKEEE